MQGAHELKASSDYSHHGAVFEWPTGPWHQPHSGWEEPPMSEAVVSTGHSSVSDRSGCRVLPSRSYISAPDFPASCPYIPTSTSIPAPQAAAETALQDSLEHLDKSCPCPTSACRGPCGKRRAKPLQPLLPLSQHTTNTTPVTLSWAGDKPSLTQVAGGEPTLGCWQPCFPSKERARAACRTGAFLSSRLSSLPLLFPGSVLATGIANRERGMLGEWGVRH